MPVLEISMPLDLLLSSSNWAWLIALCVATVATFTRLSRFSFFMENLPIAGFVSSGHVALHQPPAIEEGELSSDEELTASTSDEKPEESEMRKSWSFLAATEESERENEKEVLRPWVSSLQEASRVVFDASTRTVEAPAACTSCVEATSWSRSLHRQISARMGISWHHTETRMGMPLHHHARDLCVAESLCTQQVSRLWSYRQSRILQLLQVSDMHMPSTITAGTQDRFAHLGYHGGEIALWDVERRVCLNGLLTRKSPVTTLFVAPLYPRVTIAAGPQTQNQKSHCVVSIWDDRCVCPSSSFISSIPARIMPSLDCRAHEFGVAGEACVSSHDLRMLRGNLMLFYSFPVLGKLAQGGQRQSKRERGPFFDQVLKDNSAHEVQEDADEYLLIDKMPWPSSNHLDTHQPRGKRRCSFIINCLSLMCCLVQDPNSL